jgi:hypothetical protein
VDPVVTEFMLLVFVMVSAAVRVLVNRQLESALAGGVYTTVRVAPVRVVALGVTAAPVSSFTQVTPLTYLVMLAFDPEVSVSVTLPE